MRARRAVGSRFAGGDLIGTLHDDRIYSVGSFCNRRSVALNWRRD